MLFDKIPIKILAKYFNYNKVFLEENVTKLLEYTKINNHIIKLEESKQLFFKPIYSLKSMKLEILKTYIKTNLVNGFIQLFKSLASAFILFN